MNTLKLIISIAFCCVLYLSGCDDPVDIPPNYEGTPVFQSEFIVNGTMMSFEAGVDDYVLLPDTYVDSNNIVTYRTIFRQTSCPADCGPILQFEFLEGDLDSGPNSGLASVIKPGEVPYYQEITPDPEFIVSAIANLDVGDSQSMFWILSNGSTVSDSSMEISLTGTDPLQLCIKSQGNPACSYSQCIITPSSINPTSCVTDIDIQVVNDHLVKLSAKPSGTPPFAYSWSNGDFKPSIFHTITNSVVQYTLFVRDATGCTNMIEHRFPVVNGIAENCQLPIEVQIKEKPVEKELQFSTVKVTFIDEAGEVYTSFVRAQDNASFKILSVEDYTDVSVEGQFKHLSVEFNCTVFSENNGSLELNSGGAVIAIELNY